MEKIGVIDVGGGLRGIYAAGVFDWCMDNGVQFDYGIGISAGSANLASYLSGQRGRQSAPEQMSLIWTPCVRLSPGLTATRTAVVLTASVGWSRTR